MLYYVASPYSKYTGGVEEAFREAARYTAALMERNLPVYSPIVHSHALCSVTDLDPLNHKFWMEVDKPIADLCSGLIVACMSGWDESIGVHMEIEWFNAAYKPIYYARLNPDGSIHWLAEVMTGQPL